LPLVRPISSCRSRHRAGVHPPQGRFCQENAVRHGADGSVSHRSCRRATAATCCGVTAASAAGSSQARSRPQGRPATPPHCDCRSGRARLGEQSHARQDRKGRSECGAGTLRDRPLGVEHGRTAGGSGRREERIARHAAFGRIEVFERFLDVGLCRFAEPNLAHGAGRSESRIRFFTTGHGSDGSSRSSRSARIRAVSRSTWSGRFAAGRAGRRSGLLMRSRYACLEDWASARAQRHRRIEGLVCHVSFGRRARCRGHLPRRSGPMSPWQMNAPQCSGSTPFRGPPASPETTGSRGCSTR